ncbi:response regulator [Halomicrobium sp. ZPS1]|uniref:Response regulator n=1 Tax=Halomicrobium mukohataei TaxID=57705 RepID=A0A4D6KGM8_9EURY|nr:MULTISPECIES: response regulator [Halomicrobium]QCD66887.1 response regulator [Halomicrobium mukohataei]QFR21697.1 response regulator [Halomicrobium sp. ZPS1]
MSDLVPDEPTVLVVEDEPQLADLYAEYIDDSYTVLTAYSGEAAIETLHEAIDVVLLDRRMPVCSGNEVLAAIEDHPLDCRVAMVTAVDPDFDIIELGVDDYLVKPVSQDEIREVVDRLFKISEYNDQLTELTGKKLKRNVLQVEKPPRELEASDRFQQLEAEIRELEATVETIADDLDVEERDLRL